MKKVFYSLTLSLLIASCGNAGTDGKSTEGGESQVGDDQIENPATPENPTAKNTQYAVMTFASSEHNFGDILENQKVETTYEFVNTGKVDLLINDCQVSCGCTVPNWPKTPIKPGEGGKIRVVFDSTNKEGLNNKTVTVLANIEGGKHELKFTANVRALKQNND
jgi:hypothetical protein